MMSTSVILSYFLREWKDSEKNPSGALWFDEQPPVLSDVQRSSGFCAFQVDIPQPSHSDQQLGNSLKHSARLTQEFWLGFGP